MQAVVDEAKAAGIPIRVGVNSGSLEKPLVEKYGGVTAKGLAQSAMEKVHMIEDMGYDNLVVSIKSSDVLMCVEAHELVAQECLIRCTWGSQSPERFWRATLSPPSALA